MIPADISGSTESGAEKKVFRMLRSIDSTTGEVALHSLNLSEHLYKENGEIDFLVLGPRGIYVLEVKGGRVYREDGIWVFQDRYGNKRRKSEGPFQQAKSALYSLLDRLDDLLPELKIRSFGHGYAAVFPDQSFAVKSVEWADEQVLDNTKLARSGSLRRFLRDLYEYGDASRRRPPHPIEPTVQSRILRALRPEFELVPSVRQVGDDIDTKLASLTEHQYSVFDGLSANDQILCEGSAGTGKTMIALELARRAAYRGERALLVCSNPILAGALRSNLAGCGAAAVAIEDVDQHRHNCDLLLVDEGQDLANLEDLTTLDGLVAGGLVHGKWRYFYDANNQAGIDGKWDASALELLKGSSPSIFELRENCRNTEDIVMATRMVTGADLDISTAGRGPSVEMGFFSSREEMARALALHLDSLVSGGVLTDHMTVLTASDYGGSAVDLLPPRWSDQIIRITDIDPDTTTTGGVTFSSVPDFKGLESRFVALVDVADTSSADRFLSTLYVGFTRARVNLWVAFDQSTEAMVTDLTERNLILMRGSEE